MGVCCVFSRWVLNGRQAGGWASKGSQFSAGKPLATMSRTPTPSCLVSRTPFHLAMSATVVPFCLASLPRLSPGPRTMYLSCKQTRKKWGKSRRGFKTKERTRTADSPVHRHGNANKSVPEASLPTGNGICFQGAQSLTIRLRWSAILQG